MNSDDIRKKLFELQDKEYKDFMTPLIPMVEPDSIIGIKTPELKKLAAALVRTEDVSEFLDEMPHRYFEENQIHAFMISGIKDFDECIKRVGCFLPYVDNWATCDQMNPAVFKKHRGKLLEHIKIWIAGPAEYTVRFAVKMLMDHYLNDGFDPAYPEMVAAVDKPEYYVNMMRAWYFATALAKQYDAVIGFIENRKLDTWTHNKAIQKAVESRRITEEEKEYLRTLRIKKDR